MMNNELFEKVEYLRENANIGYEDAATLLERCDGDLTKAMIELERTNRVHGSAAQKESPWDNMFTRGKERVQKIPEENWFKKLTKSKVQFTRDGEKVAEVPVIAPIAAAILMPYAAVVGAVVGGLAGYRVRTEKKAEQDNGNNGGAQ